MYLDYTYYSDYGGTLSETDFDRLNKKAQYKLDFFTNNRIQSISQSDIDNEIKDVLCEFIEIINKSTDKENIKSYSNDGLSITYDNSINNNSLNSELYSLAVEYLPFELISSCVGDFCYD